MREIIYRAKVIKHKNPAYIGMWVYGYYVEEMGIPNKSYIYQLSDWNLNIKWEVDPNTVGEYINLRDKNGKEIYEFDIVKFPVLGDEINHIGIVTFIKENLGFYVCDCKNWERRNLLADNRKSYSMGASFTYEVIGNKFENPELIEETK